MLRQFRTLAPLWVLLLLGSCSHQGSGRIQGPWAPPPAEQVGGVTLPELEGPHAPKAFDAKVEKQRAESAWEKRDERVALETSLSAYEKLAALHPDDGAIAARLSRGYFLYGSTHLKSAQDKASRRQAYVRGMLFGEHALALLSAPLAARLKAGESLESSLDILDKQALPAMLWYTANLGGFVRINGMTTLLFYRARLEGLIERMVEVDESYCQATPRLMHAVWLAKVPSFAGGNLEGSRAEFERAVALAPQYVANTYAFALNYAVPKRDQLLFDRLMGPLVSLSPDVIPEMAPESRLQLKDAQSLFDRRNQLF